MSDLTDQELRTREWAQAMLQHMDPAARWDFETHYGAAGLRVVLEPPLAFLEWAGHRVGATTLSWLTDGRPPDEAETELLLGGGA